jgi:threonine synthase
MCSSFAVRGTFDDCQRMVKAAFMDAQLNRVSTCPRPTASTSGRLLPQAVYYAAASLKGWSEHGEPVSFVVPSGNLGNSVAGLWARRLGMPIGELVLAHNANRTVPDLLQTGSLSRGRALPRWPRPWTSAIPATSSGCARCIPDLAQLRATVTADVVTDEQIRARIRTASRNTVRSGVRTRPRPPKCMRACRRRGGRRAAGCWSARRIRPSSVRSSNL